MIINLIYLDKLYELWQRLLQNVFFSIDIILITMQVQIHVRSIFIKLYTFI